MQGKRIHLICNAHIDPVWQWEWEEGAAEALSTFRVAAAFCEEFDDFVFCHNEAILYQWVEEYEPTLFQRIRKLVAAGKWHIMGGWFLQPDCNLPSGEGMVRQILSGRRYFAEKFGVTPTTAINFDPFGHSRGLVQLLAKSGFDSYIVCRPSEEVLPLPANLFRWEGFDGSSVTVARCDSYNTLLGRAHEKIAGAADRCADGGLEVCLWGVGDHGGGASREDLEKIGALRQKLAAEGTEVIHSTPEAYFAAVAAEGQPLPVYRNDLNPWAVGCYTSQIRIKQKYRQLESTFFLTERMCADAASAGLMPYPEAELSGAAYDMLTAQFHDILPGSSVQGGEEMGLRMLDHGLELLSRAKARAFFALSGGQQKAAADRIPVLVYNPFPYPVETDIVAEMMLWDQNWTGTFSQPQVYRDGAVLPTQCEKEASNINLDWRKRICFHAVLEPMQMNRFDTGYTRIPEKPVPPQGDDPDVYRFDNGRMQAVLNRRTGLLDSYRVDGREYVRPGSCALQVRPDDADPWGMCVTGFPGSLGAFTLLSPEEGAAFSGVTKGPLPSFRIVEDGPVRTVAEAVFGYERSRAVVTYRLSKRSDLISVSVRVQWNEKQKLLKLALPVPTPVTSYRGQTVYGEQQLIPGGRENCAQRYELVSDGAQALGVADNGVYGTSCEADTLYVTLLRSPAYTAHPLPDRETIPQNRFTPHIEQGERLYEFLLCGAPETEITGKLTAAADLLAEPPMALAFYPSGEGSRTQAAMELNGGNIRLPVFKQAEDGCGYILRLFNPAATPAETVLTSRLLAEPVTLSFGGFALRSFRLQNGTLTECDLTEQTFSAR